VVSNLSITLLVRVVLAESRTFHDNKGTVNSTKNVQAKWAGIKCLHLNKLV